MFRALMRAVLALEDGRHFIGESFGAPGTAVGEACFNTSMTGYQEVLTDPSYRGQIVAMTAPQIGNYGVNALDDESSAVHVRGFVIEELSALSSKSSSLRLGEDMIATTACRHAVKANDVLAGPELRALLQDMFKCEMPYCCPHGRPTLIQISYPELERKFGRRAP